MRGEIERAKPAAHAAVAPSGGSGQDGNWLLIPASTCFLRTNSPD